MNDAAREYRAQVARALHCTRKTKKLLLQNLDKLLLSFLEEEPAANLEKLIQSIGSPTEMAETLRSEIPSEENHIWLRNRYLKWIALFVVMFAVVLFVAFEMGIQSKPSKPVVVTSTETIAIYEGDVTEFIDNMEVE